MFVERSIQYTSFSSRKQPENAGTERKQFTESASVALQQPLLTHAHTKCPPVQLLQCFGCPHIVSFGEAELRQSDLHAQLLAPFVVLCVHL